MLREFIAGLYDSGDLVRVHRPVSRHLEAAGLLKALDGQPVLLDHVTGSAHPVVSHVFSRRDLIARALGCPPHEITPRLAQAIDHPTPPPLVDACPGQDVVLPEPDLDQLPILFHCAGDGGPYIASAVVFVHDAEYGRNASFHRLMVLDRQRLAIRIVPRHLSAYLERAGGELDVAVCIGLPVQVLLAAATSVDLGMDELGIANALAPVPTVRCQTVDVAVPADAEWVLEGHISTRELVDEGPFVDLTETYDLVRRQPVLTVRRITHRRDALYHALLPGGLEHKMLMGLPREPTIWRAVNEVCDCTGVHLTPGGASWLHAVVGIRKQHEGDGPAAIAAAFQGHRSLKHVVVVDDDIDVYDMTAVEWAIATRFQASRDLVIRPGETGSSLDPSADPETRATTKLGLDATIHRTVGVPLDQARHGHQKVVWPTVDVAAFLS
ncbi:MAG: UbiD family decarboxylase [Chloroflexi bacterium]|nr:UbiD family decarboxylase [Chloroflexota bacterium]MBU1750103.1 UbiD family decarboxylase [Chloroflexota bacterium]